MGKAGKRSERDQGAAALAFDLEGVLEGKLAIAFVLSHREKYGEVIDPCLHGISHFLADEDLRTKDATYKAMQEAAMHRLVLLLRSGASDGELSAESFLK